MRAAVAAIGLVLGACFWSMAKAAEPVPESPIVGMTIPDFSAPLFGGGTLSDETLKGKWSVVEFWGLWCEDSLADADHSAALARAIAQDPGLSFYTVHVDQRFGRWGSVEAFFAEEGVSYPVAFDPHKQIKKAFGVKSTPAYLVIDPNGVIRAARGELRKDEAREGGVKAFIKQIAELRRAN